MSFWYKAPKKIDEQKVYDMMQSEYTAKMGDRSAQMIDPNSALMQGYYANMRQDSADSLAMQNRMASQKMASMGMGGQSGIMAARQQQAVKDSAAGTRDAYTKMVMGNLGQSNSLLQAAGQNDMMARDAMASAYGQNITAQNNWQASKDAFWTDMMSAGISAAGSAAGPIGAAMIGSDKRLKKNVKKIGKVKAKDGQMVNIYSYQFKGEKKPRTGVIAQEIEKSHPDMVIKNKKGMRAVNYKGLFG